MARPVTSSLGRLAEDYRGLRDAAAVVDLAGWPLLRLTGADAREFLQGTATQDFTAPPALGTASRALFLTEKGRSVAHAWVAFGVGPPAAGPKAADTAAAWILADPGARSGLKEHLERLRVMEDVEFDGPDEMPRLYGVAGPERDPLAEAIASKVDGAFVIRAEPLSFLLVPGATPPSALPPSVDPRAFEAWRIRAGLPLQGIDLDQDRIATELNLPEAISASRLKAESSRSWREMRTRA